MDLLLETEVADMLHRSRGFVRKLRQSGELQWIPGAGRAPLLISRESVQQYIERTLRWHAKRSHQDSSKTLASGTSRSQMEVARKERAFGQQIYKSRKRGFRAG